jgi:hypothetical protein
MRWPGAIYSTPGPAGGLFSHVFLNSLKPLVSRFQAQDLHKNLITPLPGDRG